MILPDGDQAQTRAELRAVLDDLLDRVAPRSAAVHRADAAAAGDLHRELWHTLVADIGVLGLAVPEESGGAGASFAETAVVFEACGRALCSVPLWGAVLAVDALARCENPDLAATLDLVLRGEQAATVAFPREPLPAEVAPDGTVRVSGELAPVADGVGADLLVTVVNSGAGPTLALIDLGQAEVACGQLESLDLTRQFSRIVLTRARAAVLRIPGDDAVEDLRDLGAAALACEQLGVLEQALADAVEYATQRTQFGRPIGSFQAVKHLLADLATEADLARSAVEHAIWAVSTGQHERQAVAMAALATDGAACLVTAENIQVHGGIGFSWEHPAHLAFRKARSNAVLLGDRTFFADRLLSTLI